MDLRFQVIYKQAVADIHSEEEIRGIAYNNAQEHIIQRFGELVEQATLEKIG